MIGGSTSCQQTAPCRLRGAKCWARIGNSQESGIKNEESANKRTDPGFLTPEKKRSVGSLSASNPLTDIRSPLAQREGYDFAHDYSRILLAITLDQGASRVDPYLF